LNSHPHLEEFLQRDLDTIQSKLAGMAGMVERALRASLQALTSNDRQKAYSIILRDQYIDMIETEVDRLCLEFMVRHQPVAGHLRFVFAVIQINRELERAGDFAEGVARQVLALSRVEPKPSYDRILELAQLALHMLGDAMESFLKRDSDLARRTMLIEDRVNTLRQNINVEIDAGIHNQQVATAAVHPVRTIARRFEGVGDRAKNICEEVLYMCTGEFMRHPGSDTFRVLFLDASNSTLSLLAEAVGRSLKLPRFVFNSAGLTPQPMDQRVVRFMESKGLPIPPLGSKSLDQVPDWQYYQVIITLNLGDAWRPDPSSKAIHLRWSAAKDLPPDASAEDAEQGLQAACAILETQIKELVNAVLEEPQPK
jgi:phosphate transport system protein